MTDVWLFAAAMSLFLIGLVVLGLIADSAEARDARRRNQARPLSRRSRR